MSAILKIFSLISLFIILISCNKTYTEPEPQAGRRDYVWTADTIDYPFDTFVSIWGSKPSDVWAGGVQPNDLYHFNSLNWTKWGIQGKEINSTCKAIWGLAESNIWIGGIDGKILHFDGYNWKIDFTYKNENYSHSEITDFCGSNSNDIYAIGYSAPPQSDIQRGILLHFDGSQWTEKHISTNQSQFFRIKKQENKYYINSISIHNETGKDTITFYEYDGIKLKNIFSKPLTEITFATFNTIGEELYFLISKEVYIYHNSNFSKLCSLETHDFGFQIYGRNKNDLFIRMTNGLAHYDGNDIEYLYKFGNSWTSIASNAMIFEKDVFFLVQDALNNKDFILHGKLKE